MPEVTDNVILGMDFLKKMNATICGEVKFEFDDIGEVKVEKSLRYTQQKTGEKEEMETMKETETVEIGEVCIDNFLTEELEKLTGDNGVSNIAERRIIMKDDTPFKHLFIPSNPAKMEINIELVDDLLENEVSSESAVATSVEIRFPGETVGRVTNLTGMPLPGEVSSYVLALVKDLSRKQRLNILREIKGQT